MSIADKLTSIAENSVAMYNLAESKKATVNGNAVKANNVSGYEHNLKVNLSSKNLLAKATQTFTANEYGLEATISSENQTITYNGTATSSQGRLMFKNYIPDIVLPKGTYTAKLNLLSGTANGSVYLIITNKSTNAIICQASSQRTFTLEEETVITYGVHFLNGCVFENAVFNQQLELGSTATAYTPYIRNFSGIEVSRYGKNLIPYPYKETTKTTNGITFNDNGDGTITVNGTATGTAIFSIVDNFVLPAGTRVTLSGCPQGGSQSSYFLYYYSISVGGRTDVGNGLTYKSVGENTTFQFRIKEGVVADNWVIKPQLEIGTTKTEYEPYKAPQTAKANADGTVEGLKSLSPNMTLITDNGSVIDCTYYTSERDPILQVAESTKTIIQEVV
ncbi:MAG: hypothetical protein IKK24_03480 [Clostridia bacterium]|nr:hypothetical protein [Clostridia bacterium]